MKRRTLFLLIIKGLILCACNTVSQDPIQETKKYYVQNLNDCDNILHRLSEQLAQVNVSVKSLQEQFKQARLAYKRSAFLIDYHDTAMARLINGPPVPEVEIEDNLNEVIMPQGFQVIEAILFEDSLTLQDRKLLVAKSQALNNFFRRLRTDAENMDLSDALIFDALKSSLIEMTTLGFVGYDTDKSGNAIIESGEMLFSLKKVTEIYRTQLAAVAPNTYKKLSQLLSRSKVYIEKHEDFSGFDRMFFIINYANPIAAALKEAGDKLGIAGTDNSSPLNSSIISVFDSEAFRPDYFTSSVDDQLTDKKVVLGKFLFFDPVLSGNRERSCGTCHQPGRAFTDGLSRSNGIVHGKTTQRNALTLINAGLQPAFFYDSRVTYLEDQIADVISNKNELNGNVDVIISTLRKSDAYRKLFNVAFPMDGEVVTPYHLQNALASYIRSLTTLNSRFDKYVRGDHSQMSTTEIKGFNIYMGKARCGSCHFAPLFNGAVPPRFNRSEMEVIGVPVDKNVKKIDPDKGGYLQHPAWPNLYAFRTPTLRNIALTAPYMHNGVYSSLEEVIEFYDKGGGKGWGIVLPHQTLSEKPLKLTNEEKLQLISFLKTITDTLNTQSVPNQLPALTWMSSPRKPMF
ncbi:cytochrome-c peroxidase [Chitinophaga sp. RAB17]|uniref:cytochrome-c peroxidase n=1 Tax=Chitinophaga sp. RAB17 TaxID=3233049 RepID=UPI003F91404D